MSGLDNLDPDYLFATKLNDEINGNNARNVELIKNDALIAAAIQKKLDQETYTVSDEEEEIKPTKDVKVKVEKTSQVSIRNSQGIMIHSAKKSDEDYYMKEFCTYVNPHYNQDWAFIKFLPNIQHIFDKLKTHYFEPVGMKVSYDVAWDSRIISDGSDYKIFLTERKIFVNTITLGFRPRIVLFSTLFHALVHLYLFEISMGQIAINSHDENFRSIMLFLNKKLKTEFTTSHKFFGSNPTLHNQGNWYHCKGACVNYEPFYGIVRCTNDEPPSQNNKFWNDHMDCGGGFFKVMEVIRYTNNNDIEKEFVTSIRYQTPKPHQSTSKEKTNIKAREMVDLTDDTNQVQVQNLMEVIDLDDSEFIEEADAASIVFASKFMAQRSAIFTKCSICQRTIGGFAFASHVDYCFGQSKQNVVFPGLASIDSLAMLKCPSAKKRKI